MKLDLDTLVDLGRCPTCGGSLKAADGLPLCRDCGAGYKEIDGAWCLVPKSMQSNLRAPVAEGGGLRGLFVRRIYARHNMSGPVKRALKRVLAHMTEDCWGLNIGAGGSDVHPRVLNLDLAPGKSVDAIGDAQNLPFRDEAFRCVLSQEVFEHLPDPWTAMAEAARVLEPGGLLYIQVPFIIGYHSGPQDYWRFTDKGLEMLVRRHPLEVLEVGASVGAGTGMYRISVEYAAALAGSLISFLYLPVKGLSAILLAPLRLTDLLVRRAGPTNRICGGFYVIARKLECEAHSVA